ncbi:hypothetical protein ACLGIH_20155 [Streptomyces sp. HMX87]|uniref:hypothetical protein n=1 Tax=Streptomyces sp. HMX87 TaxID=3390849 RepID=UPI003A8A64DB
MATLAGIIRRVRSEIGDFSAPFVDTFVGGDELSSYDLSEVNVSSVQAKVTVADPASTVELVEDTDYVLNPAEGSILLINPAYSPLKHGQTLIVRGTSEGMFSDADLETYVADAMNQHTYGRTLRTRYRDGHGHIRYDLEPIDLENLPAVEEPLVAYLAVVNVLWTLATDASTDIDVNTSEGTFVPRSQRYRQLMEHLAQIQDRYNNLAQQLNVGLGRIEMFQLRRISRTTNRLVPLFQAREYDDTSKPERLLPPIDGDAYDDESGIPSPLYPGTWG